MRDTRAKLATALALAQSPAFAAAIDHLQERVERIVARYTHTRKPAKPIKMPKSA